MLTKADIRNRENDVSRLETDVPGLKDNMNDVLSAVIRIDDKAFGRG